MSVKEFHVAVTTDDGKVHDSTYSTLRATWSPFKAIAALNRPDSHNLSVSLAHPGWSRMATVDDSVASELRCSFQTDTDKWTAALSVATGVGLARAHGASGGMELLGLGAPETAGWSFGLPIFWVQASGASAARKGDAAAYLDPGDLDPGDLPSAFDFWGDLGNSWHIRPEFFLALATESGGIYFADLPRTGKGKITSLKTTGAGDPGFVIDVACTGPEVFVVNDAGKILHASRRPDGTWRAFGDVNAATHSTESFRRIAIFPTIEAGLTLRRLHLLGATTTGGLFHAYRSYDASPDPLWSSFEDVKAAAGDPGAVQSVSISGLDLAD